MKRKQIEKALTNNPVDGSSDACFDVVIGVGRRSAAPRALRALNRFRPATRGARVTSLRLLLAALLVAASSGRAVAQEPSVVDPAISGKVLDVIRRSNPDLAQRRAALEAARAGVGAAGYAPPIVLSSELDDVPGLDLAGG